MNDDLPTVDEYQSYNPCGDSWKCKWFHEPHLQMRNRITGTNSEGYSSVYEYLLADILAGSGE